MTYLQTIRNSFPQSVEFDEAIKSLKQVKRNLANATTIVNKTYYMDIKHSTRVTRYQLLKDIYLDTWSSVRKIMTDLMDYKYLIDAQRKVDGLIEVLIGATLFNSYKYKVCTVNPVTGFDDDEEDVF